MAILKRWRNRRCGVRTPGPFFTEWRCLLTRKHDGPHEFEPDRWIDGRHASVLVPREVPVNPPGTPVTAPEARRRSADGDQIE